MQFDTGQGGQVFVFEEQHASFTQPLVLGGGDPVEKPQVMSHPLPHVVADRVLRQDAPATPGAQGPHRESAWVDFGRRVAEAAADDADDHR